MPRRMYANRLVYRSSLLFVSSTVTALFTPFLMILQSVERMSGCTGYRLRSTLLSQAKAFVEAKHEANKTALVKRLDSEKWVQVRFMGSNFASLSPFSIAQDHFHI